MKKAYAIAAILIFLGSCAKKIEVYDFKGLLALDPIEVAITSVEEDVWEVGLNKEQKVSRGVRLEIETPKLSKLSAKKLTQRHGIDHWIYRFVKHENGSSRVLGYVRIGLAVNNQVIESFTANLAYHAASVSMDFRRFRCPAFNHRLRITDLNTVAREIVQDKILVRQTQNIRASVHEISFSPIVFSTGSKMRGRYEIDFALYNSSDKTTYSPWIALASSIAVVQEVPVNVESCKGIKEEERPLKESRTPKIEDFRIR